MKSHYFDQHAAELRTALAEAIPREALRALHVKSAPRHLAITVRQFAILGLCTWGLIAFDHPLI